MNFKPLCLFVTAVLFASGRVTADVPAPSSSPKPAASPLVGTWRVEFTNGVRQTCTIAEAEGRRATVTEPGREADGDVAPKDGSFLISYHDDRIERWTHVGPSFVVEHWFPATAFPAERPVLGIADHVK